MRRPEDFANGREPGLAEFRAAISSMRRVDPPDPRRDWYGEALVLRPKTYVLDGPLTIDRQVAILGEGGGGDGGTTLLFPSGSQGLLVSKATTIRNVTLASKRPTRASGDPVLAGIYATSGFYLSNCTITGFVGCGIYGVAYNASGQNFINWRITSSRITNCGVDGLYIEGDNAHVGLAVGLVVEGNGRYGIWDASQLGNTYIGCSAAGNASGSYRNRTPNPADLQSPSMFIGCRSDVPVPYADLTKGPLIIGGAMARAANTASSPPGNPAGKDNYTVSEGALRGNWGLAHADMRYGVRSVAPPLKPWTVNSSYSETRVTRLGLGGESNLKVLAVFSPYNDASSNLRLTHGADPRQATDGWVELSFNNRPFLALATKNRATPARSASGEPVGSVVFPEGFILGTAETGVRQGLDLNLAPRVPPTSQGRIGDVTWNHIPDAMWGRSVPAGWVWARDPRPQSAQAEGWFPFYLA